MSTYTKEQFLKDVAAEAKALKEPGRPWHEEMIGRTYERLTVVSVYKSGGVYYADCKCSCGKGHVVKIKYLTQNSVKSCGCLHLDSVRKALIKYDYNKTFFASNTPEMFYVLGLFYTDGNLSGNRCRFRLGFKAEDKYLLERIAILLKGNSKLDYNKIGNAYELSGTDQTIYDQLTAFGLTPRKSMTIKIRPDLIPNINFWRGVIDGNGWITTRGNSIVLGLCGTMNVCQSFLQFCSAVIDISKSKIIERKTGWGQITIYGFRATEILKTLYEGKGELFLIRKYNKYAAFLRDERKDLVL
jgi:hypothetical protein